MLIQSYADQSVSEIGRIHRWQLLSVLQIYFDNFSSTYTQKYILTYKKIFNVAYIVSC